MPGGLSERLTELSGDEAAAPVKDAWAPVFARVGLDNLASVCGEAVVQRGVAYWLEGRVRSLAFRQAPTGPPGASEIVAEIDGARPGRPYAATIRPDPQRGGVRSDCTCPFEAAPHCKHAVAAWLEASRQLGLPVDARRVRAEQEVAARRRRGRSQVSAELVEGQPWFGTWSAWSDAAPEPGGTMRWRVQIRSLDARVNSCDCPDFATNQLGTCKHIEAVLHRVRIRHPEALQRARQEALGRVFLHVVWAAEGPRVEAEIGRLAPEALAAAVRAALSKPSQWTPHAVDAESRLAQMALSVPGVWVGDDVWRLVRGHQLERRRERAQAQLEMDLAQGASLPDFRAALYPFQRRGAAFLAARERAVLGDEAGLGKSVQALGALAWLRSQRKVERTLVVCPPALLAHWQSEFARWGPHSAVVITGSAEARGRAWALRPEAALTIAEVVAEDVREIELNFDPDLVIVDEAERLADWASPAAMALRRLSARHVFALTSAPIDQRPALLYGVVELVWDGRVGPLWRFELEQETARIDPAASERLRRQLEPIWLRRTRLDVAPELPPVVEKLVVVPPSSERANDIRQVLTRHLEEHQGVQAPSIQEWGTQEPLWRELVDTVHALTEAHACVVVFARNAETASRAAALIRLGVEEGISVVELLPFANANTPEAGGKFVWCLSDELLTDAPLEQVSACVHLGLPATLTQYNERLSRLGGAASAIHSVILADEGSIEPLQWAGWRADPVAWRQAAEAAEPPEWLVAWTRNAATDLLGNNVVPPTEDAVNAKRLEAQQALIRGDFDRALQGAIWAWASDLARSAGEPPPDWGALYGWAKARRHPAGWLPERHAIRLLDGLAACTSQPKDPHLVRSWVERALRGGPA